MLAHPAVAVALLSIVPFVQERAPQAPAGPSPEEVARAVSGIESALRSDDVARIRSALDAAQAVPHRDVVRAIVPALDPKKNEKDVVIAGLQALRWCTHPSALEALHQAAEERELRTTPEFGPALFRAIGQHADPKSIELLAHDPLETRDGRTVQARILALGRIRTKESVEALMDMLATTNPPPHAHHRALGHWIDDLRLSLMVLTGLDHGKEPELWERWWRDNRKTFEPPEEAAALPKPQQQRWDSFWGAPRKAGRAVRREDRGGAPVGQD